MGPAILLFLAVQAPTLTVEFVGNAGVSLSDGSTTLLVDLPYEPGAFGYMRYDPGALRPAGTVVSVITHDHRDHFDPGLFLARAEWRVVGPPSVTRHVPAGRRLSGDSVQIGAFAVVAIATPHTEDHRSYRVRWRGRVLHFVGDTEQPESLAGGPVDLLFVTPWLSCLVAGSGRGSFGRRSIAYHHRADRSDRMCGPVEVPQQGTRFSLTPAPRPG